MHGLKYALRKHCDQVQLQSLHEQVVRDTHSRRDCGVPEP